MLYLTVIKWEMKKYMPNNFKTKTLLTFKAN